MIVCLMSGATNIMALEGIKTQDVCLPVERHSNIRLRGEYKLRGPGDPLLGYRDV